MDPQKNPLAPAPGDDLQNPNPAGPTPKVSLSELSEEAAHTPAVVTPVAGQKIEPGAPEPAVPASTDSVPGANPASVPAPAADAVNSAAAPEPSQQDMPAVPPVPANEPANPLSIDSGKRRKKGLFIGLVVAAVILLLSGGAAAAYYGYYLPNKPENVLKKALANSFDREKVKTVHFNGEVTVSSKEENVTVKTTYNGQIDQANGSFLLSSTTDALVTNITSEVRSADGKTFYFKVGSFDGLADLMTGTGLEGTDVFAPAIEKLNNQWIEINEGLIKQALGDSYEGMKLSDSDARKLAEAYEQNQFVVIKEALSDQEIKGVPSHHYRVVYDVPKLKSFVRAANASDLDLIKLTDEQLEQFEQTLDESNLSDPWDIWIGKSDKMIRQVVVGTTEDGVSVDFRFTVDSYNQPVTVEKPEDAISILELMGMLFGDFDQAALEAELDTLFTEEFEETLEVQTTPSTGISL